MSINYSWDYLMERYISGAITDEELEALNTMIAESPIRKRQFEEQTDGRKLLKEVARFEGLDVDKAWEKIAKKFI